MDSTVSLLKLWQLCVRSQGRGADENLLNWETLRKALDGLPMGMQCERLRCSSVNEILTRHFGSGREHVNFTRYWHGMEVILISCDTFHQGSIDALTQQKVTSLRHF